MSAATAQPCVVCHAPSSKYKCPTCRNATCSLACSKQHAAQGHSTPSNANQVGSGSDSHSSSRDQLLPSLHLRNETIQPPQAHRFSKVEKYVGLKEYDSKQLMEDFEYLQYLGKCVTLLGKDITKNGWLKDEGQTQNTQQNRQQGGSGKGPMMNKNANGFHQHISAEVKNRQTFESWIRKLRLPIMLVPDGMSLRNENQTRWKNNTKQLLCTVEIRVPTSSQSRSILHHIPWDKQIAEVVVKEMERKAKQKNRVADEVADEMMEGIAMDNWSQSLCITISVSNDRLRNESSSRFLEWWQRQVKNGMVKADGLEFDEEKKGALEQLRNGAWAAIEGMESAEAWPAAEGNAEEAVLNAEAETSSGGLISSLLLDKMQAARAMKAQLDAATQVQDTKKEAASTRSRRNLIILEGKETFQDILQSLTKGLAIVEYFRIELWTKEALLEQMKSGNVVRERLEGSGESAVDLQSSLGKRSQDEQAKLVPVQTKRAKSTASGSNSALGSLTAYASSDEEVDEEEEDVQEDNEGEQSRHSEDDMKPIFAGGLAEMARSLGMVPS